MGADQLAENTINVPKLICPSPKEKRLHWASVVCGFLSYLLQADPIMFHVIFLHCCKKNHQHQISYGHQYMWVENMSFKVTL
jgi:hypothetical protein